MKVEIVGMAGFFLVLEGVMSIVGSQDQRTVSQAGRIIRIGIGGGLLYYG